MRPVPAEVVSEQFPRAQLSDTTPSLGTSVHHMVAEYYFGLTVRLSTITRLMRTAPMDITLEVGCTVWSTQRQKFGTTLLPAASMDAE